MTQSQDKVYNKWEPIIENLFEKREKSWLEDYAKAHRSDSLNRMDKINNLFDNKQTNQQFPSLLPIAKRIAASTIAGGLQGEELEKLKGKVLSENRESKINSVIEGTEHVEKEIKDYPEYIEGLIPVKPMSSPQPTLLYIDYKYENKDKDEKDTLF